MAQIFHLLLAKLTLLELSLHVVFTKALECNTQVLLMFILIVTVYKHIIQVC